MSRAMADAHELRTGCPDSDYLNGRSIDGGSAATQIDGDVQVCW